MIQSSTMPDEGIIKDSVMAMMNKESLKDNVVPIMMGLKARGEEIRNGRVPTDNSRIEGMKDVTAVPGLLMKGPGGGAAKVVIGSDILEACGMTRNEVFSAAYKNLDAGEVIIRSMFDLEKVFTMPGGFDALDCLTVDDLTDDDLQMYFITNKDGFFGAMSLFGNDTVKRIGEKLGDYYIIPSSIHEMIIVKKTDGMEPDFVIDMIRQINDNVVDDKDILSYELYQYDAASGRVITCESEAERQQDFGAER